MIKKTFDSKITNDSIEINHNRKSQYANFNLVKFDQVADNLKLIVEAVEYLKNLGIMWIIMNIKFKFEVPSNTVWFKNNKDGTINCHIEDFEKFYFKNMSNFVKINNIYIEDMVDNDGWTVVVDKKKLKKERIEEIKTEIEAMVGDWNNLI